MKIPIYKWMITRKRPKIFRVYIPKSSISIGNSTKNPSSRWGSSIYGNPTPKSTGHLQVSPLASKRSAEATGVTIREAAREEVINPRFRARSCWLQDQILRDWGKWGFLALKSLKSDFFLNIIYIYIYIYIYILLYTYIILIELHTI